MNNKYFVFKLNLSPDIIDTYKDMDQLKTIVIPNDLKRIFQYEELSNSLKLTFYTEQDDFRDSEMFDVFNRYADQHEKEYLKIVSLYKKTGGFEYTAEYQKLNDKFGNILRNIFVQFPYLKEVCSYSEAHLTSDLEYKVGTGKTYVERQRKIRKYLSGEFGKLESNTVTFFYERSSEFIYIDITSKNVISLAKLIQKEINNKKNNIGKVSINPISEKIEINITQDTPLKEVTFNYVYPNGKTDVKKRNEAIKRIRAEKENTTYLTSSMTGFSPDDIKDLAEVKSKLGYLSDVLHKGHSIIRWIQKEVSKEFK